jgi:hypothetical protein
MTNDVKRARANDEYTNNEFERVTEWGSYLLGPETDMRWTPGAKVRCQRLAGVIAGLARTRDGQLRIVVEHAPAAPGILHIYAPTELALAE